MFELRRPDCRAPEAISTCDFEVDHIRPVARGGGDQLSNLALACRACNLRKQMHTEFLDADSGQMVPLFNPRADRWMHHFQIDEEEGIIVPLTAIGRATVELLDLNSPRQILARLIWIDRRLYP